MSIRKKAIIAGLLGFALAGCSSQQPVMTVDQQKSYNQCMSGHWSGEADTFLWGPVGWAYHDSVEKDCYAKSGSVGSMVAADQSGAGPTQPAAAPAYPGAPGFRD